MTPEEIFTKLIRMFPKYWDEGQKIEFADLYKRVLRDIDPEILKTAYEKTMSVQKFSKPPMPGEIRDNVPSNAPRKPDKPVEQWPHRKMAHQMMFDNPECKNALREGWGLGMWEYIARVGKLPDWHLAAHLRASNDLFHRQYAVCGTGEKIEQPIGGGKTKMLPVDKQWLGMFEKQIQKREKILETYGA